MKLKNFILTICFIVFVGVSSLSFVAIHNSNLNKKIFNTIDIHRSIVKNTVNLITLSYEYLQYPYNRIAFQLEKTLKLLNSNKKVTKVVEIKIELLSKALKKFKLLSKEQKSDLNDIAIKRLLGKVQLYSNQIQQEIFKNVIKLNSEIRRSNEVTKNLTWLIAILTIFIVLMFFLFLFKKIMKPLEIILNGTKEINKNIGYKISIRKKEFIDFQELIFSLNKTSQDLKNSQDKLKFNQKYLEKVFEVTPNILVTTNGEEISMVNDAMLKFTEFKTLKEFNARYDCIGDLFLEGEGLVQKVMGKLSWLDYILSRQNKLSKVSMMFQGKQHIFIVLAKSLELDKTDRSLITFIDITDLEDANKEILLERDKLTKIFESMTDGIYIVNSNYDIEYINPILKKEFGSSKNKKCYEYFHGGNEVCTWCKNERVLAGETVRWEWFSSKNNKLYDLVDTPINNADGTISKLEIFRDITELKEIHQALEEKQKIYEDFFEHTKSANIIYTTTDNGKTFIVKNLNHLVEKIENVKENEIIGKRAEEVFKGIEEFGLLNIFREVYRSGKPFHGSLSLHTDEKLAGWRENYVFKLSNEDIVVSYEDRTKERKLEVELHDKEEIMISQSRHAAMGEMISMIAHQWRQPLSVIAMGANNIMADIELDLVDNDILKDGAMDIIEQTQELSKTIDDFRNFFRPMKITENILVEDVFNDAFKVIGKSLENNEIEIITNFDNDKEIETYSRELMQVLINILKNAKEALVEYNDKKRNIIVSIKNISNHVEIKICDNAGGIHKEIIDKIFHPYFTTKEDSNGTGLGLYMSKTIIEKHLNGTIEVYNEKDGACFNIKLPYSIKKEKQYE